MTDRPGPSQPSPLPDNFHTDLTVGEILRRTRVHYNISYEKAERDLRIKAEHLEALEHNSIERLPGRVYVFGYVRTYSDYLGLDGEKMVSLLKKQAGRKVEKVRHVLTMPVEDDDQQKTPGWHVTTASGIALLVALIIIGSITSPETPDEIPPVPKALSSQLTVPEKPKAEPVSETTVAQVLNNQLAAAEPQPAPPHPVVLKALSNTWLEIRDDTRKVVFSRVLAEGEEYWVPQDQTNLFMTLGNAGGLQILVEGQPLPLLGAKGQVRRNVPLNVESLRPRLKKPAKTP